VLAARATTESRGACLSEVLSDATTMRTTKVETAGQRDACSTETREVEVREFFFL